jgi:hypothetical protein
VVVTSIIIKMKKTYAIAVLVFLIMAIGQAQALTQTITVNLNNPPGSPSITGNGWISCTASGSNCGGYCAATIHPYNSPSWEPGYTFSAPFEGEYQCTLTVRATGYSELPQSHADQNQEWVQGKVNSVVYDHTPDVCTNQQGCACSIGEITQTRSVYLYTSGNVVTVRRGWHSVDVKGGYLTCTGTMACEAGYLDEYQCNGGNRQRRYQYEDCSTEWRTVQVCDYGCEGGECIPGCDPGYTNETRCSGNWLQIEYQNYDCTTTWHNAEYCEYGCQGGACKPSPDPYCTDTDGGIVWTVQGNVYGRDLLYQAFSKTDYCSGNTLFEYYCEGVNWAVISRECDGLCRDGKCVPDNTCEDECPYWGKEECVSGGTRVCGYWDSDPCLEWDYRSCDTDCCDDPCDDCNDDCEARWLSDYRCSGNWRQRLWIDANCDERWQDYEYCPEGCSNGQCQSGCTAGYLNEYRCQGNQRQRKYQFSDCTTEWRLVETCQYGCLDNQCTSGCTAGYLNEYQCLGNILQRQYRNTDCSLEWRNYQTCQYGCSNNRCNDPTPYCGDGICDSGETCSNCPQDCGICPPTNYCGDGICDSGETCSNCPQDCGLCPLTDYCGDGICGSGETCSNCPQDCGSCPTPPPENYCGDGICGSGETCSSCPQDCGTCHICGDGVCSGTETCLNCEQDCGICITPCGIEIGENVEVTTEACIEFEGNGSSRFDVTVYNREEFPVVFDLSLSGEAAQWAERQPPSLRLESLAIGSAFIHVEVPEDTQVGLYELNLEISSGGVIILEKKLFVSVTEPVEGDVPEQRVEIIDAPAGAVIAGNIDLIWIIIGAIMIANIVLLVVIIKRQRS